QPLRASRSRSERRRARRLLAAARLCRTEPHRDRPFVKEGARAAQLAETIAAWTRASLEELVERHLPEFHLPRTFAGYPVGPDVRAALAYTLGLLDACGHGQVAGVPASESIPRVLKPIDGAGTHTFFSYRVAETLARAGTETSDLATHPWLA